VETIRLRKENNRYKEILETKIDEQNRAIEHQRELLILQSRMACFVATLMKDELVKYSVKQILIKYGGSIEVYNDNGAVFKIVMPS